jgi:hypothetical protein
MSKKDELIQELEETVYKLAEQQRWEKNEYDVAGAKEWWRLQTIEFLEDTLIHLKADLV